MFSRYQIRSVNRLNHALNFAHIHSNKDLSLDLLASRACLSKYHFSRLFQDYTGETPARFVKRIRLENAAHMLSHHSVKKITDIALCTGFSSNQTFTRAFVAKYGYSPRQFRACYADHLENALPNEKANRYPQIVLNNYDSKLAQDLKTNLTFVYRPPTTVAYFRNIGAYGISDGIDHAVSSIRQWAKRHNIWNQKSKIIGASWDSNKITPNTFCKYDACIPLPNSFTSSEEISVQTLPGGLYAVSRAAYRLNGEISLIWRRFVRLLHRSPKLTGYRMSSIPCFEIFGSNPVNGEPEIELNILLLRQN